MYQAGNQGTEEGFRYSGEPIKKGTPPTLMQQLKAILFTQSKNRVMQECQGIYADVSEHLQTHW